MKIKVGDAVNYTPFFGGTRTVTITATYSDVKNGRPGFDGTVIRDGATVWGYTDQITAVNGLPVYGPTVTV